MIWHSCHHVVSCDCLQMNELAAPSPATMVSVVETSNAVAALTYLVTALAGYITFADTTRENLLKNFEPTSLAPITGGCRPQRLLIICTSDFVFVGFGKSPVIQNGLDVQLILRQNNRTKKLVCTHCFGGGVDGRLRGYPRPGMVWLLCDLHCAVCQHHLTLLFFLIDFTLHFTSLHFT